MPSTLLLLLAKLLKVARTGTHPSDSLPTLSYSGNFASRVVELPLGMKYNVSSCSSIGAESGCGMDEATALDKYREYLIYGNRQEALGN